MSKSVVNISLLAKSDPTVNITINDAGVVSGTGSVSPIIKFVASGEAGPTGAQGPQGTIAGSDVVTTTNIQDGAVSTVKLADDSVTSDKLGPNSVFGAAIPNLGIDTTKIGNQAVTGAKIAPDAITSTHIAPNAINEELIESGIITRTSLADGTITSDKIQNYTLVTTDFSLNSVDGTVIVDNPQIDGDVSAVNYKARGASPGKFEGPDNDEMHLKFHTTLKYVNTSGTIVGSFDQSGNFTLSGTVDGIDIATDVAANTAKNSYPTADATKVSYITVTQPVDLDALETKLDTIEVDADVNRTNEELQDVVGPFIASGGTKTGIAITYNDATNDIDFVVDHDAATNFVAEEHYRWDNDIQSTATINHVNLSSDTPGETEVLVINDGDAVWGHGEKIHIQVRNDEGSTISAGAPLYSKGEIGGSNRILVGVCDANDSSKMPCIGVAHSEMNTTSTKDNFAVVSGIYNTNISGFTSLNVGDNLYIQNDGSLSQFKPSEYLSKVQNVGIVLRTNGSICQGLLVSAIGRTNDLPNLNSGTFFMGNSSNLPQPVNFSDQVNNTLQTQTTTFLRNIAGEADDLSIQSQGEMKFIIDMPDNETGQVFTFHNGGTSGGSTEIVNFSESGDVTIQGDFVAEGDVTIKGNTIKRNNGDEVISFSSTSGAATFASTVYTDQVISKDNADFQLWSRGNIEFRLDVPNDETGQSFSFMNHVSGISAVEIANLDESGNLQIDGDLTVSGNEIKDEDGTTCITFDSSGNTTIANTLNASVTGNVTGNVSGSSGSCTGNAATATALTAGNKTLDGNLTIGANGAGHDLKLYGDTNSQTLVWDASEDFLKFTDGAKIVFGTGQAASDFDSSIQANGSNLVIYNDTGNIQIGDTVEVTGDLTVSGDLSIGDDAEITSVGNMTFRIDSDNDELAQSFLWKDNANDLIVSLSESGLFSIFGTDLGNPKILLSQSGPTATYGPPLVEFLRNSVVSDNADIGRFDFNARNSSGSEKTYAQILGLTEESGAGTEGGKIRFKIASHDAELVDGLIIEDGDAEDEIDVTIANGSSSLTTVAGNLNVTTNIELGHASDTTIARTAAGAVSIEGKEIVTINKQKNIHSYAYHYSGTSAHFIPMSGATTSDSTSLSSGSYHLMQVMPFDGRVVRIAVFNQTTTTRNDLFEMYIDGDDSDPSGDQRGTDLSFTSAQKGNGDCATDWTFSKGEAIAIRRTPSAAVNGTTVTVVFEFDMTT